MNPHASAVVPPPRIAVVGCGYWGKNLVRNFHSLGALQLVVDATPAGRATAAALAPGVEISADFDAILSRPEITAVALATPAATHHALGLRVLASGKDLFVEKPMALDLEEGADLVNSAARLGRIIQVDHLLEYHPAFTTLRELATAGRFGKILRLHSHRLNFGKVRTEEDALWSLAPHDIAMILRLAGRPLVSVSCSGHHALGTDRADTAVALFNFADGLQAHIFCSWLQPIKEQRLTLVGDAGMAVFDDTAPPERRLALYDRRVSWENGQPVLHQAEPEFPTLPAGEPLHTACAAFLHAVTTRHDPLTDGASGLRVLAVLDACRRSMRAVGASVSCLLPAASTP
jgi:UDP-2-acetamido-3-amino-2,3-dideoxy-glucuronate N-acetyltransferase